MIRALFCALVIALLTSCGAAPPATAAQASVMDVLPAAGVTAQSAPTAQLVPTARPVSDVVIRFERSGGMMGRTSSYSIRADGSIVVGAALVRDGGEILPAPSSTAMADLLAQIAAINIAAVSPGDYSPANACCDRYAYTLSLSLDSGNYTYTTVEAAQNQPAALASLIELVQAYIEAAQ